VVLPTVVIVVVFGFSLAAHLHGHRVSHIDEMAHQPGGGQKRQQVWAYSPFRNPNTFTGATL